MDRIITSQKENKFAWVKEFEYLDLIPYSIALMLLWADVYILSTFVSISRQMHYLN